MKVISLFSGCGGLDWGFHRLGFETVWANEINEDAAKSFEKLIGLKPTVADINSVISEIPNADIVIGGPPCQSFSLVGKRIEDDERGKLVFSYYDVIKEKRPSCFVLENVPGLIASKVNNIKVTDILMKKFSDLGYEVSIEKLIATNYFVPQKRQRVFIVGWRNTKKGWETPKPSSVSNLLGVDINQFIGSKLALDDLPTPAEKGNLESISYKKPANNGYSKFMRENNNKRLYLHSMPTMSELDREFIKFIPPGGNYMNIPDEISTKRILKFKETGGRTTTYGRLDPDKASATVNTYFNRPNVGTNYHYKENRLITVREALRLQSFPDDFVPHYKNQRSLHMQIGNAVPPLLSYAIASKIKEMVEG